MMNPVSPTLILMALATVCILSTKTVEAFGVVVSPVKAGVVAGPLHSTKGDDDFPRQEKGEDEYTGDVDWDAEWKKVMEKEKTGRKTDRPGKDFYKSDAEIAAIRAANKASTEVEKISNKLPSPPSMNMQSLTGDWKFWIGILALISIGSAVLSAPPSYDSLSNGGSYYI